LQDHHITILWDITYTKTSATTWHCQQHVVGDVVVAAEWCPELTAAENYCTEMMATDQQQGLQGQSLLQMSHHRQLKI